MKQLLRNLVASTPTEEADRPHVIQGNDGVYTMAQLDALSRGDHVSTPSRVAHFFRSLVASQPNEGGVYIPPELRHLTSGGGDVVRMRTGDMTSPPRGVSAAGVSLRDFDIRIEDFIRQDAGSAMAAAYKIPEGQEPGEEQETVLDRIRTIIKSGGSAGLNAGTPPEIESAQLRMQRGSQSLRYFLADTVIGPTVRALYEYVIGPGWEPEIVYEYDETPPWFKATNPEVAPVKRKYEREKSPGGKRGALTSDKTKTIFLDYLKFRASELHDKLDLDEFAIQMAKDGMVTGDGFAYRLDSVLLDTYLEAWLSDTREFLENDIGGIQVLNPLAVTLETDEFGVVNKATIRPQQSGGGTAQPTPISDLTRLVHLKHAGSPYTVYGVPITANALTEATLKESLLRAAKASADRYSIPIRLAQYGIQMPGSEGGPIATPAMREDLKKALENYNPETGTLLGPYHWKISLIGAEGDVINLADEIQACDRRIMMALGIPPSFLDGNYTSFSTAKIQFSNMILKLRSLQNAVAKLIEDSILRPWAEMRGYRAPDGSVIKFKVRWKKANLENDPEIIRFFSVLAKVPNQRVISDETIQETLGFSHSVERQRFEKQLTERAEIGDTQDQDNPPGDSDGPGGDGTDNPPGNAPRGLPSANESLDLDDLVTYGEVVDELRAELDGLAVKVDDLWEESKSHARGGRKTTTQAKA